MIHMSPLPVGCSMRRCGGASRRLAAPLFLACLLAAMAGCAAPRITVVPEVSPPLQQEEVFALSGPAAGNVLFPCAAGVGWVDLSGRIVSWDPEKKAAGPSVRLPFAVSDPPFCQGDFLALKSQTDDQWLVFDLAKMEIRFALRDLRVTQILAVDGEHLVYLDGENLVVYSWRDPAGIYRLPALEKKFFNCHFYPDRILVMSSGHLFIFWKRSGKFQLLTLPVAAAAGFACQGEYIYYGSCQRQLVKYSPRAKKPAWKLKLGQPLERQPFISGGAIMISPADNNVMQVNGNGSVRGWLALDSILQFNLLPMADHLAAFLLNQEIKFIGLRRRQETVFKISGRPAGMPVAYKHSLYFLQADGKTHKLQRVGNRYGIDLALAPEQENVPGMAIVFSILTRNLLRPRLLAVIRDEAGQTVLTKKYNLAESATLVWIPAQAGVYRLQVSAAALNRNENEEQEISFRVFDPQKIIPKLYFHF